MQSSLHHASLGPSLSRRRPQTASALSPILTVTYSDRCIGYNVAALQSRPSPADMKRLLLPAVLATILAAGCAQNSTPAPYGACATQPSKPQAVRTSAAPELKAKAQAAADDAGKPASCIVAAPLFRPDFRAGVRFDETQRMRFSFSKEAVSEGAPEQIPDFSASIIVKGDSISASLSALNTPFWRISATPSTTAESRHPLLSSRFRAKGLIRDLTFMYWPVDSIRASLAKTCPDCTLSVSGSTRTLARSGQRVLESSTRGGATVLRNYPEGYELSIEPESAR